MTTLMIDNYDSFTYNVVQYLQQLGANVLVKRNDEITIEECLALNPINVVVSPGPGNPRTAGISMAVIDAFAGKVPVLGVCLGEQSMYELWGGKVSNAPAIMHGKVSKCYHDGKGVFEGVPQGFEICRYHSLVGIPSTLPDCLEVTATSYEDDAKHETTDGPDFQRGTIMGVRHKEYTCMGVQFHPESCVTQNGLKMIKNFLDTTGGRWAK